MIDQQIEIPTKDGHTTTFISHPERGGPFPVILFYMDAPAIREELRDMARRLATSGYYVMLPNMYYRSGVMELGPIDPDPESPERKRMFELMNSLTIPLVMEDTKALLAYADGQAAARKDIDRRGRLLHERTICRSTPRRIFPVGSRPPPRSTAPVWPPTSPTARISPPARPRPNSISAAPRPTSTRRWRSSRRSSRRMKGANAEVEIYPGTHHGFAFPKRPVYDRDAAERHWERLLALYRRNLSA